MSKNLENNFFYYFPKFKFSGKDIYQNIGSGEVIFNFFGSVVIFFVFFTIFRKKKSEILKKLFVYTIASTAQFYYKIVFLGNFPHPLDISGGVENCQKFRHLHPVVCGNDCINDFWKAGF